MRMSRRMGLYSPGIIKDVSITANSITSYRELRLDKPQSSHYLGYINNQGHYWIQFKITPTTYTTSLKLSLKYDRSIEGSVNNSNFPWHLAVTDTQTYPTNDLKRTTIHVEPNRNYTYVWTVEDLSLKKDSTYYLSVWAGSSSYPGGVLQSSGYPSYSIVLNPSN